MPLQNLKIKHEHCGNALRKGAQSLIVYNIKVVVCRSFTMKTMLISTEAIVPFFLHEMAIIIILLLLCKIKKC